MMNYKENSADTVENYSLKDFIALLKDGMGIPIEELTEMFGVDRTTIFNWARGSTRRININTMQDAMGKLRQKYGIQLGRITHANIEVINVGGDQIIASGKSKIKSRSNNNGVDSPDSIIKENEILLQRIVDLKIQVRELERKIEEIESRGESK